VTPSRRGLSLAPALGVVLFLSLYAVGAFLYPGGFSVVRNYFCDLLHPVTPNGVPNPGRSFAFAAMVLIVPTLGLFWHVVVALFSEQRAHVLVTRSAGSVSALATLLLLTPFHDAAVMIGGGFGLVAFAAVLLALPRARHGFVFAGGVSAALVSSVCFFIWRTGIGGVALAPLQKLAFALFLAWVFVASLAASRAQRA
jgi:hypothetical protein